MSSDKTCDTCVCRAVCMDFWKNKRCGPRLPHWRGDDAEHEKDKVRAEARQNDASLTNIIGGYKEALDEAEASLSRSAAVLEAAAILLAKLDVTEEASAGVYQLAEVHGQGYRGPTYEEEKSALRAALAQRGGSDESAR